MLRWTARAARLGVDVDITSLAAAGALDCLGTLLRPAEATRGQRAADPSSADSSTLCRQAATDLYRKHFQPKHTFWSLRDRLMLASARSIRWKHRLQTQKSMVITTPDVNRMAERYLVAAAAPTAAAFLARRARIAKLLEDLTLSLGCAATLLEDHDSLVPDLESQRSSAVLSDLSLCVSSQESLTLETICRNNEAREALLKNLQRTRLYLAAADSLADQLRMPEAKRHIADRRETVEAEMSRLAAFAGRRQP
jgi:Tfp pilus assembly protein PilN